MPAPKSTVPPAAQPQFRDYFDAWNSSSTGHQRAENRLGGSTGWRQSRSSKLSYQFKSDGTGGKRISHTVEAGSENGDEKVKALMTKTVRERAKCSVGDRLTGEGKSTLFRFNMNVPGADEPAAALSSEEKLMAQRKTEDDLKRQEKLSKQKGVFDGLVVYINGSTYPLVSDHKLKHLLAENGARISLHLGRRQVTHVILGKPSGAGIGAGGGLSGTKMEKEIRRVGGCGVKYVGVEWYVVSFFFGVKHTHTSKQGT
jgi:hypothetical protein